MDIDNDTNQVLSSGQLVREPDRQAHTCTSIVQNSTSTPPKTVSFFPRVLLSVQQPLSGLINQTILQPTALTTTSVSGTHTSQSHISSLHMSVSSVSSPVNSTSQFFPLILAATSAVPSPTSSVPTPLQLHLSNYSTNSSGAPSSNQGVFLQSTTTTTTPCLQVPNVSSNPRLGTPIVTSVPSSTSLVASLISKTCSTSPSVASVVISPHASNHIQPTLALRFAPRTPGHCGAAVTTATASPISCPLVFETPATSTALPLQSQRPHCVTTLNFPAPVPCVSGSLLMSSTLCSTPRVLIHKPQSISHSQSLIGNLTSSVSTTYPNKINVSSDSVSNCANSGSSCNSAIVLHDQINTHSTQTSKTKLVNFSSPISATVRLITPSTGCTTTKSTCTMSTSGTSVLAFSSPVSQIGMLSSRSSIASTGSVWSGLTVNPNISFVAPSSGCVVTVQSSQSLIVQAPSDMSVQSSITNSSSLNPSLMMSLRSLPGSSSNSGSNLPLSTANHTVLAFNLANSNVHSTTTCPNITGIFTNPVRQITPCNPTSPLIVRASGPSGVGYIPNTTSASSTGSTSLLKPFSLCGNTGLTVTSSSSTPVIPHILPVNIAPAKLTPLQPSVAISTSVSHTRSNFVQNASVCIGSHRLPTSSVFSSQPSRKRARKQQLASSFSSVVVTSVSVVSSTTTAATSINSAVTSSTLTPVISGCRSVLPATATLVTVTKPNIQPHQFTQPVYSCQVSHSPQVSSNPVRSSVIATDSVYRNTSTTLPVSCSTNVNPSTSGLMGIRLVSVRTTPTTTATSSSSILLNTSCFQSGSSGSYGARVSAADNPLIVVTSPSHMVSSGGHLRIASSHSSQTSDIHQSQAAAVYVLTTSVFPILSTTTVNSSNSGSGTESTCSTLSSISPVVVPGGTNNVLQVRFRPPPPGIASSVSSESQEFKNQAASSHTNSPSNPCTVSDVPKSISEDPKCNVPSSKPFRCASESNPLLHHLVSSLKQSQTESATDMRHIKNTHPTGSELSVSNPWPNDQEDSQKPPSTSVDLDEEHSYLYPSKENPNFSNHLNECDDEKVNNRILASPVHNVLRKRTKSVQEVSTDEKVNETPTKKSDHQNNKPSKTGVLWTVDPVDGCEWILSGRPSRPLINPRCGSSSTRLSGSYRSKNTHFLSLSEICIKSQSKSAAAYESSRRTGLQSTRRRRRSLITRKNASNIESLSRSKGGKDVDSLRGINLDSEESDAAKCLVQDILALRNEQEDCGFIKFPLTVTSMLNTTGWRVLHCTNNLDLLAYTELQTLRSVGNMETDLEDQLQRIAAQPTTSVLPLVTSQSFGETAKQKSTQSKLQQCSSSNESGLSSQLNQAIELIKGISQRKRYLLDSIQRLSSVTRSLVQHFSPSIHRLLDELEDSTNSSSKSLSPSSKTNLDLNPVSTPLTLRRSCRRYSPNNRIIRPVRRRSAITATRGSRASTSLIKNSSNICSGTSSQAAICNGGTNSYPIIR